MDTILKLTAIMRSFGAIQALNGVDFEIGRGEVMGLVGENGAGKSTLVKIISGFDDGYAGTYEFEGEPIRFHSPGVAEQAGIAIAQQELSLIPAMSVAENVFLAGHNVHAFATKRQLAARARRFLNEVGLTDIDPTVRVDRLSIGEQHLVEVARLIAHDPKVLILDEPTAALGEFDSIRILHMVKKLAAAGKSIIYVSHRLDEIFKITDRITVLRDGESQRPRKAAELNVNSLVELMLGRKLENMFPERAAPHKHELLLSVRDLWPDGMLEPVSFDVYAGEILGLAGQLGSGAGEILAAMAGSQKTRSGAIDFGGETFLPRNPAAAIRRKLGYCSDDRKYDGLFLGRPIRENLTSPALETVSRFGWNFGAKEQQVAHDLAEKFTVDVSRLNAEAGVLSGGNQQKVALGKWLAIAPKVILVNEPTRGVDVGAKAEIYQKMRNLADEGAAIVFASTDMQEITYLPDRVITFYRGMHIGGFDLSGMTTAGILKEITDPFNETNL